MKNAEKYAKQIAEVISEDTGCCTCTKFGASLCTGTASCVLRDHLCNLYKVWSES